ncbi:MAG: hypothetical protein DHS20C17_31950 [Cyclobacteriaceae bacterium]|nr:MAG: hypothetical protein DHS20C17_31950 [Cyclobacteriaceae bacterium]
MNPKGIIFGPKSSLEIGGSFYATTANSIELEQLPNGARGIFHANKDTGDILTSARPEAFGFLGSTQPGLIILEQSSLKVPANQTIALVGGDINITGTSHSTPALKAPGGKIIIVSASQGTGKTTVNSLDGTIIKGTTLGQIKIKGTEKSVPLFDTRGDFLSINGSGGTVTIRGGELSILNSQIVTKANPFSTGKSGKINISSKSSTFEKSTLSTDSDFAGSPGAIYIDSENSTSFVDTNIQSISNFANEHGETVRINAPITDFTRSSIITSTTGVFDAGDIEVKGDSVSLHDSSEIASVTLGSGKGGKITINALEDVTISDINGGGLGIRAQATGGLGQLKTVELHTNRLTLKDGGQIKSESFFGSDQSRQVNVNATEEVTISGEAPNGTSSKISTSNLFGSEGSGAVFIDTGLFTLQAGGRVESEGLGDGKGGTIAVRASEGIDISGNKTGISTKVEGVSSGGNIDLQSEKTILLTNEASLTAESFGEGNAGGIKLSTVGTIRLESGTITTQAFKASGGDISLNAEHMIHLRDSTLKSSVLGDENTTGGNISLDPQFVVLQGTRILATAESGFGGNIEIVGNVLLADPFSVDPLNLSASSARGPQFSGNVDIRAPIQNLSETIAPLSEEILKTAQLFSARCASLKGGKFSSFVKAGSFGITDSIMKKFLPSPLIIDHQIVQKTAIVVSRNLPQQIFQPQHLTTLASKELEVDCTS